MSETESYDGLWYKISNLHSLRGAKKTPRGGDAARPVLKKSSDSFLFMSIITVGPPALLQGQLSYSLQKYGKTFMTLPQVDVLGRHSYSEKIVMVGSVMVNTNMTHQRFIQDIWSTG